jgi:carboxyl-terminal processing protease
LINKIRKSAIMLILVSVISIAIPVSFASDTAPVPATDTSGIDSYFKGVMEMIKTNHKGDVTDSKMLEGALKGMFQSADKFSVFFNKKEASDFITNINGNYKGIGVMISEIDGYVVISKVFSASPAEKAGLFTGDKIIEAAEKSIIGKTTEEAASIIRGEKGTKVIISIIRNGETIKGIEIERDDIKINPVVLRINNGIANIKLEMFNENTNIYLTKALEEADKQGVNKILLDLRNNPGGELWQAILVAQKFVPRGLITKVDYKADSMPDEEFYSYLDKVKYKLVVLVNENSASASEVVSGAIQDTKAGTLVGTKTYGKAKVQTLMPILTPAAYEKYKSQYGLSSVDIGELMSKYNVYPSENDQLGLVKLTVAYYYTPNGRMIDEKGLTPDVKIDDPKIEKSVDVNNISELSGIEDLKLYSSSTDILSAEKILTLMDYDINKPDTKMDLKTAVAISHFQKDSGIATANGVLDVVTQKIMNQKLEELRLKLDGQYAKGVELLGKTE